MKRMIIMALALFPSLLVLSLGGVSYAVAAPCVSDNSPKSQVLQGSGQVGAGVDCNGKGVTKLTSAIVSILSLVVGIAAIVIIIIAGFKYITSAGDTGKIASAKTTLVYAIVGLVVAAFAQVIVHFVLNTASSSVTCPSDPTISVTSDKCK